MRDFAVRLRLSLQAFWIAVARFAIARAESCRRIVERLTKGGGR
jgi:hypothetical protein